MSSERAKSVSLRTVSATTLIVLGAAVLSVSVAAVWINRTIMDEDRWVATVAPLAQDPDIQAYAAQQASNAIIGSVDIQGRVQQILSPLPTQAQALATPITGAIEQSVREAATKVAQSPQFYDAWAQMNRSVHKGFIAAISDRRGAVVQKSGGTVTLDVGVLVDRVKRGLAEKGLGFVDRVNIPVAKRKVVLFDSPAIARLGSAVRFLNASASVLPLVALLLLAAGVALAPDRPRAVLWLGGSIAVATVLPIQAVYLAEVPFARAALALGDMPGPAAQAAYRIVFRDLVAADRLLAAVGLVFICGALVAGPSRWAMALRSGLQSGLGRVGAEWDFGIAGQWVLEHRSALRSAGAIVALVILLVAEHTTIWTIVWLIAALLVWLGAVAFFGRPRREGVSADDAAPGGPAPAAD
jgi:hypothetical protein